ncbi:MULTISPECIES: right-handed parallel beta-helix repeat-containing protein [Thiorhodovibrio]|uniref:right-handed parallel beta-helix repeat-containing protein n=1 Tax=Thiorhodovibrio TaxID=61593 RepID=UPI001913B936|nr:MULTISPECIES: right-handed parallel beta-helix repeat-containing protein [Thiorhodovibrio]MBK5970762.1 hypothetical protein [Thiorhodovibrio winogradskyi]WPL10850.1 nitrous oxide reductase family maturation protein NosD [Thiorhodovibrio litoralis]
MKTENNARKNINVHYVAILMFFSNICLANTITVDTAGNDSNPGTTALPVATLQKAIELAESDDVIEIKPGRYESTGGIKIDHKENITISGVIDNGGNIPEFMLMGGYVNGVEFGEETRNIVLENISLTWMSNEDGNVLAIAGSDITVRNNKLSFDQNSLATKYDGIKILATAKNILIQSNEISKAPQQCIDAVGGIGIVVRGNKLQNCDSGIVLKGGTSGNLIEFNFIRNMTHSGIGLGGTTLPEYSQAEYEISSTTARENIITYDDPNNIGGGIFLRGAENCTVENNSIYGPGIYIQAGGDPAKLNYKSANNVIKSNIVWRTGNDGILVVDAGNDLGLTLESNCYWKTTGSGEFKINGTWLSYASYLSDIKFDSESVFEDPAFLNPQDGDFIVPPTSPCFTKGADQSKFTKLDAAIPAPTLRIE